jgi:Transposase DDE domain
LVRENSECYVVKDTNVRNLGVALLRDEAQRYIFGVGSFRRMKRAGLAATIKARWICEQAHQQLKEKLGLDHFEGRSWQGLHRHALMTMIAYAFLQHRHLTQVGRKKESTDRRLSLACRPYATPSSISFFDHYLSNAHTAEDEAVKNSGVGKSAKVVLVRNSPQDSR